MDRLTLMRSFVGVTKSRSFSQAARTLGISGSLVSRHVAELERDLGVRLVNRTARTVSLTEAGTATVRRAGELLPRAQVEIVPGAPHSMYWETPALFNDAVGRFLARVCAAEPAAT